MQRLGFGLQREGQLANIAQGTQYQPGSAQLGYMQSAQQMGPGSLLGQYGQLSQLQGQAGEPYRQQRYLEFQGGLQNAANRGARRSGIGGLIGGGIGAGAGLFMSGGNPMAGSLGFGLGSGAGSAIGGLF